MGWTEQELIAKGFRVQGTHASRAPQDASRGQDDAQARDLPESSLRARVRRCALENSFLTYHTYDSRRSEYGYPDLTLAKPGRLIFAELKARTGKLTHEQEVWLDILRHSVPGVEAYCWRPSDFNNIVQILTRK